MTTTIHAHFDGKQALVLDEPVDLPVGTPLRVHVEPIRRDSVEPADDLLAPVIVGLDETLSQAIANDPEFAAGNMTRWVNETTTQRMPLTMDVESVRAIATDLQQAWRPLDCEIDPELGRAIAEDPEFNIEES